MIDTSPNTSHDDPIDVLIVGAGFAGMYMLHRCRQHGLSAHVVEAATDVGGTWYWNRYPGARCDVESLEYSYSFDADLEQEWRWTERYASQPEILSYAQHVAERFDLKRDITFGTRVTAARFDETTSTWQVATHADGTGSEDGGGPEGAASLEARFVVMATGCLSSTNKPDFEGMDDFAGEIYHTGEWPHEGVDFSGKRVGVIGTGSSGIQAIPLIAAECDELTVFQRTPNYSLPAHNGPLDPAWEAWVKTNYPSFRQANREQQAAFGSHVPRNERSALEYSEEERQQIYEERWQAGGFAMTRSFGDLGSDEEANQTAQSFVADKIAELVDDADTAALLTPDQLFACKRMCVDTDYFATYNQDHVHLVDVRSTPIETFTPTGLRVGDTSYDFDIVVLATGYDAMTGSLLRVDFEGRSGQRLTEAWSAGPVTYLGLTVPGFPNLFTVTGPGSPSVLTNMIMAIEQHVEWISDCIVYLTANGLATIEASAQEATAWVGHVNRVAEATLFTTCNSWYLGVNIPGKPRVYMPLMGFPDYVRRCDEVAADGYRTFALA